MCTAFTALMIVLTRVDITSLCFSTGRLVRESDLMTRYTIASDSPLELTTVRSLYLASSPVGSFFCTRSTVSSAAESSSAVETLNCLMARRSNLAPRLCVVAGSTARPPTVITTFSRSMLPSGDRTKVAFEAATSADAVSYSLLLATQPWPFSSPHRLEVAERDFVASGSLEDCSLQLVSSADKCTVVPSSEQECGTTYSKAERSRTAVGGCISLLVARSCFKVTESDITPPDAWQHFSSSGRQ
mmetsp:Transcript_34839/g.77452  ORF Transcript_34839/g.77452 Transcript_34839/m.77452 type:complete len:244 (+) Transcript_34839:362-1093(+)